MTNAVWRPKDPDETVAYPVDWTEQLGSDPIVSFTFVVTSGDATILKDGQYGQVIKAWVQGGTDGTETAFLNTVTTASGQVLERSFSLYVAEGENSYLPASTTKRQLVEQMYVECGLNGWEYDIQPEEKDKALQRLDMLMWEMHGRGLDLDYNFPTGIGAGNLDDELGCPDQAFFGLSVLGAQRLCPTMGKVLSRESRETLNNAMKAVRSACRIAPTSMLRPGTPLGGGARQFGWGWPGAFSG